MGQLLESRRRMVIIANATVLVAGVLSIGQVRFQQKQAADKALIHEQTPDDGSSPTTPSEGSGSSPGTPGASGTPGPKVTTPGKPGSGNTGGPIGTPTNPDVVPTRPPVLIHHGAVPDFGLITQGVTKDSVLIGIDYNKTGCGGADDLSNQLGSEVTGHPEKATDAFVRYVNDHGGVRGRILKYVTVDDGGLYCPDKHQAAAIELVDEKKVFLDIAGLHEISDLLAKRHLPFYGGRSTLAEQRKQGYGQFQLFQEAEGEFANWAAFGRNYIDSANQAPCLIHPNTEDFNNLEKYLNRAMAAQHLSFKDTVRYDDNPSTPTQQANTYAARMKTNGCKQVWLVANNALADIFFTNAAFKQTWFPTWTWTSRTALIDTALGGQLMNKAEWRNSIGLTNRLMPGGSGNKWDNNCKNIYKAYYPADGEDGSAAVLVACASILPVAEAMGRAIDITGTLTGNSLMLGVDAFRGDFYWDAYVPMTWSVPGLQGPFDFTAFDFETPGTWNEAKADYDFPEYPYYWKVLGPNKSGKIDVRPWLARRYTAPKK